MPAHSAARAQLPRGVDKKLACALEINGCALRPAERREIPVDWPHRMSPTDCRALENSCEALELVVPPPKHWFAGAATSDWLKTLGGTAVASETSLADGLM